MDDDLPALLAEGLGINDDPEASFERFLSDYLRYEALPLDGRDLSPTDSLFHASVRVKAVAQMVDELQDLSPEGIEEQLTKLASTSLPKLARAVRAAPSSLPINMWSHLLLEYVALYPCFARYMRTHPEASLLQDHLITLLGLALPDSVSELVNWTTTPRPPHQAWAPSGWLLTLCTTVPHLACHRSPSSPPPATELVASPPDPSQLSSRLFSLSEEANAFLARTGDQGAGFDELKAVSDGLFFAGFVMMGGFANRGSERPLAEVRDTLPWTRCEGGGEGERPRGACRPTALDGAGMLTCSRCKTVRYCSADHQKRDWKRHKALCSAPLW